MGYGVIYMIWYYDPPWTLHEPMTSDCCVCQCAIKERLPVGEKGTALHLFVCLVFNKLNSFTFAQLVSGMRFPCHCSGGMMTEFVCPFVQ